METSEELGKLISQEVRAKGTVEGRISASYSYFIPGKGLRTNLTYEFLNYRVVEEVFYKGVAQAKQRAVSDCLISLRKFLDGCVIKDSPLTHYGGSITIAQTRRTR